MSEPLETRPAALIGEQLATLKQRLPWEQPRQFDLGQAADRGAFSALLASGEVSRAVDEIAETADDLFEVRHPDLKANAEARARFIAEITDQGEAYGKWFNFSWNSSVAHFPDKEVHRELHGARDRSLVTPEEQAKQYDARVFYAGLSVGSNVVASMTKSGIGGHIILADSDRISPTNLNRMDASFLDIGERKTDFVGKKVSLVDPYIVQLHLAEGVTPDNLQRDILPSSPDIIVEETDDLAIKALIRAAAYEKGLPVVMATDFGESVLIDVERHDLGDTKPFNGRLSAKNLDKLITDELSPEEKRRFMLKVVGMRGLTPRLIDSALEVDKSLAGLPQLGTTAAIAGALATTAIREIILDRKMPSGRYRLSTKKILNLAPQASKSEAIRTFRRLIQAR